MADFTDKVVSDKLGRIDGLAADDVYMIDPAMGTGTFLLAIMQVVAQKCERMENTNYARAVLRELYRNRLIGFERSAAPYVVAELRINQLLKDVYNTELPKKSMRFLANTLPIPAARQEGMEYAEIIESRLRADHVKQTMPIFAIIGNPPYVTHAHQRDPAPWVEDRRSTSENSDRSARPSSDDFREVGASDSAYALSNTATYFWRWSTWKVFDAHPAHGGGVVALITPSTYLRSSAFAGMRRYLRATCDEGWIVDLSPEGHRPPVNTRLFRDVKEPICIGIFARRGGSNISSSPAQIRYRAVQGTRDAKLAALHSGFGLADDGWQVCGDGWTDDSSGRFEQLGLISGAPDSS